ncbi:hypothetical protein [Streptomyces sp. GC420]|uniref:hypothetical protein n=1 Tax=Streptomyces sp. GC420 TaxID=2697568 RepID=UPI001415301B|nr:hypothetical protein [Streptomyces sp. GC420]NBM15587.1 hypothetical protein [Streptomyces sp. GC420]
MMTDPDPDPDSNSDLQATAGTETPADEAGERWLHTAFAEAGRDIAPGPLPLAAVERAGRARRVRRVAGLTAGATLLAASLAVTTVHVLAPERQPSVATPAVSAPPPPPASTPAPTPTTGRTHPSPKRIVRPGERITAAQGFELWLTEDGEHWSTPEGGENFRSVVDGNIDRSEPGVSHQIESSPSYTYHSGVYYGTERAARVEVGGEDGTRTATLLELPGRPGWGAWYLAVPGRATAGSAVTLYDRAGRVLAELPGSNWTDPEKSSSTGGARG